MGISFIVSSHEDNLPKIAIWIPWARYLDKKNPQGKQVYQRISKCHITPEFICVHENCFGAETDKIKISLHHMAIALTDNAGTTLEQTFSLKVEADAIASF